MFVSVKVVGAIIFQPINRGLPLRCLEEKYGLTGTHRDPLMTQERRSQKRLSLNITNGHNHDNTHGASDVTHCQDNGIGRSSQLRLAHDYGHKNTHKDKWLKTFFFFKLAPSSGKDVPIITV